MSKNNLAQLFMFGFTEEILSGERLAFFRRIGARNFVLFKNNLTHLKENMDIIKNEFEEPLIAIDQEGGVVRRLKETEGFFFGNMNLAQSGSVSYIKNAYYRAGQILHEKGFNLNLAPVVDVYATKQNAIGIRSFSSSKEVVARFGKAAIEGLHSAGILSTAKHFVGYGFSRTDPHKTLPVFSGGYTALKEALYPFMEIANTADFFMSAHIRVEEIDETLPLSLSKKGVAYLREHTGFKGALITDCLEMGGAMMFSPEETVVKAKSAGNDIMIVSHTLEIQKRMYEALEKFPDKKALRLNESFERLSLVKTPEPQKIETGELKKYITLAKNDKFLPQETYRMLKPRISGEVQVEEMGVTRGNVPIDPTKNEIEEIASFPEKNAVLVVYNAYKHKGQIALAERIYKKGKRLCVIIAGDPCDKVLFKFADCIVLTFSPLEKIINFAEKAIRGDAAFEGISPVEEALCL